MTIIFGVGKEIIENERVVTIAARHNQLMKLHLSKICFWDCKGTSKLSEWSDKILTINIVQNSFLLLHIPRGRNSPSKKMVHYPRNLDLMLSFHNGEKQRVSFISDAKRQLHQILLSKKIFQQRNFFEQGENTSKISSEACSPAETNAI